MVRRYKKYGRRTRRTRRRRSAVTKKRIKRVILSTVETKHARYAMKPGSTFGKPDSGYTGEVISINDQAVGSVPGWLNPTQPLYGFANLNYTQRPIRVQVNSTGDIAMQCPDEWYHPLPVNANGFTMGGTVRPNFANNNREGMEIYAKSLKLNFQFKGREIKYTDGPAADPNYFAPNKYDGTQPFTIKAYLISYNCPKEAIPYDVNDQAQFLKARINENVFGRDTKKYVGSTDQDIPIRFNANDSPWLGKTINTMRKENNMLQIHDRWVYKHKGLMDTQVIGDGPEGITARRWLVNGNLKHSFKNRKQRYRTNDLAAAASQSNVNMQPDQMMGRTYAFVWYYYYPSDEIAGSIAKIPATSTSADPSMGEVQMTAFNSDFSFKDV